MAQNSAFDPRSWVRLSGKQPLGPTPAQRDESPQSLLPPSSLAPLRGEGERRVAPKDPAWRVHDRTHLELAVGYRIGNGSATARDPQRFEWEAYFFVPESFRLDSSTYQKDDIYGDLQSYVRLSAPEMALAELLGAPLERLRAVLDSGNQEEATRELRLFACRVRSATLRERGRLSDLLEQGREGAFAEHVDNVLASSARLGDELAALVVGAAKGNERVEHVLMWVREDVSLVLETFLGLLVQVMVEAGVEKASCARVTDAAVEQAQLREKAGLGAVGRGAMNEREIEHLEFRRHALKRFTTSVLWLSTEVNDPSRWAREVLYALAASVAMGVALVAALWGPAMDEGRMSMWLAIGVVAYAVKDRIKASLQALFSGVVARHFPDRRWIIRDKERGLELGRVDEQSAFLKPDRLDAEVLAVRRKTWRHDIEVLARPETVLWHKKAVEVSTAELSGSVRGSSPDGSSRVRGSSPDGSSRDQGFDGLLEIFRLDLRHWLVNTDDPKNPLVFADPDERTVRSVQAPRVYNIAVVYRLRREGETDDSWHRVRVVVSRKGIRRIDPIC